MKNLLKKAHFDKGLLIVLLGVVLISLPIFYKTFRLGLYGDDWVFIAFSMRPENQVFPQLLGTYVIGSYASSGLFMKAINEIFGYSIGTPYYVASYALRVLASLGFYFLGKEIFKSKALGFILALTFSISAVGLETTDWVFNAFVYLSIFLICVFWVYFVRQLKEDLSIVQYILMVLAFIFALAFMPHRTNGLVPLAIGVDLILLVFAQAKGITKKILIRDAILIFSAFLLLKVGVFGRSQENYIRFQESYSWVQKSISVGRTDFLLNPFVTIANMFIPDTVNYHSLAKKFVSLLPKFKILALFYLSLFLLSLTSSFFFARLFFKERKKYFITLSFEIYLLTFVLLYTIHRTNFNFIPGFEIPLQAAIGAFFIAFSIILVFFYIGDKQYFPLSLISLLSLFSFILVPQLFSLSSIFITTHRYMITSVLGPIPFLGILLSLLIEAFRKGRVFSDKLNMVTSVSLVVLLVLFARSHFIASSEYLSMKLTKHPQEAVSIFWKSFFEKNPGIKKKEFENDYLAYLFIPIDERAKTIAFSTVDFSSTPRIMVEYGIDYLRNVPAQFFFNEEDFLNFIKDKKLPENRRKVYEIKGYEIVDITEKYFSKVDI